ncbi:PXDN [Mytilus coruscus]|uniref:PXDN n=1 Tax=Mytilus coruscus TaxID=42192 RepID=A0A6J8CLV3_MYTCO|nr:PXDN [Mytilus coruscus]
MVYRSADGSCNNIDYPEWGKSFTPQERFIPAHYEDEMQFISDQFLDGTYTKYPNWGKLFTRQERFIPVQYVDNTYTNYPEWDKSNSPELRFIPAQYVYGTYTQYPEWCKSITPQARCIPAQNVDGTYTQCHELGKSFTRQERFIPAEYVDGIDYPRDYDLPSPRLISNKLFNDTGEASYDRRKTAEMMAWGQLLAHDFILTPTIAKVDCCDKANEDNPACFPIEVPEDDAHFSSTCMNFVRSSPATIGCVPAHREQVNELTSYIDGSMLYGSTKKEMDSLREFSGGRMRCTDTNLLPENSAGMCLKLNKNDVCQAAGDSRVDVVPNLGGNHILLMREHNRIADELVVVNPHWDDERVFQETRKIVIAMIQHISYNEYLPGVIGPDAMTYYDLELSPRGYDDPYDPDLNPSVRNAFAAAAFRFGHSQVMPEQAYLFHDYVSFEHYPLEKEFMNTHMIQKNEGKKVPALMRWLSYDKAMDTDRFFVKEIRDLLFLKNGKSSDLPAINIQRGRDHGLPAYNAFREHCGLSTVTRWNPNADEGLADHRWSVTRILKDLYQNVADIDLFAGAITENKVPGGLVGPTFACLIGEQFEALKKGDRFWYETSDSAIGFTEDQLHSIKRMKLSKLFCENFGLHQIQRRIFNVVSEWNGLELCTDLPDINLQLWREN